MSKKEQRGQQFDKAENGPVKWDEAKKNANRNKILSYDNGQDDKKLDDHEVFNFENLRLSQNFSELAGVKKAIITIPVRKPNRQDFIRVHPGEDWRFETAVLEFKEEREIYLMDSSLWSEFSSDIIPKVFFTTINRQSVLALWPVRLPGEDGRLDQWNQSALLAAKIQL